MADVLVIGYGNSLRGDDGIGRRATQDLTRLVSNDDVEILDCHQLTPELSEPVSRARFVIFIDASAGLPPGEYSAQMVTPLSGDPSSFTHHLSPAALLACAERLYGHSPKAVVLTIGGRSFGFGEQLSPEVSAALPGLIATARALITKFYEEQHP